MALFGRAKREFLESFLKLGNGIPSHAGYSGSEPGAWLGFMELAPSLPWRGGVDGKTLRRSYDPEGGSPLHLVSAWAVEQTQLAVDGKSNEIVALPKLRLLFGGDRW